MARLDRQIAELLIDPPECVIAVGARRPVDVLLRRYQTYTSEAMHEFQLHCRTGPGAIPNRRFARTNAPSVMIIEATYGGNCQNHPVPAPDQNRVSVGNASSVATRMCAWNKGICLVNVDANLLGDPARGCAKDFSIKWRCKNEPGSRTTSIEAEANGKDVLLSCVQ